MHESIYDINLNKYTVKKRKEKTILGDAFIIEDTETKKKISATIIPEKKNESLSIDLHNLTHKIYENTKINHPSVNKYIGYTFIEIDHEKQYVLINEYCSDISLCDLISDSLKYSSFGMKQKN